MQLLQGPKGPSVYLSWALTQNTYFLVLTLTSNFELSVLPSCVKKRPCEVSPCQARNWNTDRPCFVYQYGISAVAGIGVADHLDLEVQAVEGAGLFPGVGMAPAEHVGVVLPQVGQRSRPHWGGSTEVKTVSRTWQECNQNRLEVCDLVLNTTTHQCLSRRRPWCRFLSGSNCVCEWWGRCAAVPPCRGSCLPDTEPLFH